MVNKAQWHHLFIDGRSVLVQSFYKDPEGRNSGFLGMIELIVSCMKEFSPKCVTVFWGEGISQKRKQILKSYSHRRAESRTPHEQEQLQSQIALAKKILSVCPIRQISVRGVEAPDAIAYTAKTLQKTKLIVANSKEYFQLLREDVQIFNPEKQLLISEHEASIFLGFPVKHFLLWKCIVGDSSKGVKGIPGIGKVKAKRLIQNVMRSRRKFPLRPNEQAFLDRNRFLFSLGALLEKDEKQKILELFQSERRKSRNSKEFSKILSSFGVEELIQPILYYHSKNNNKLTSKFSGGVTLQ